MAMRRIVFIILMFLLSVPAAAENVCSKEDFKSMKESGLSSSEIRAICFGESSSKSVAPQQVLPNQMNAPQLGVNCRTAFGVCSLAHLPPAPIGTPCFCFNRYTGMQDPGTIQY